MRISLCIGLLQRRLILDEFFRISEYELRIERVLRVVENIYILLAKDRLVVCVSHQAVDLANLKLKVFHHAFSKLRGHHLFELFSDNARALLLICDQLTTGKATI